MTSSMEPGEMRVRTATTEDGTRVARASGRCAACRAPVGEADAALVYRPAARVLAKRPCGLFHLACAPEESRGVPEDGVRVVRYNA